MDTPKYTSNKTNCTCEQCSKAFYAKPNQIRRGHGKYCSRACSYLAQQNRIDCVCKQCGIHFQEKVSGIKDGKGKYCSKSCYGISKQNQISCVCEQCGKTFQVIPAYVKRGGGKYCSQTCHGIAARGKGHPLWRGGLRRSRGSNWSVQRKLAYNRDKGECQYCGKKPLKGKRRFQVHHIKPFREFNGDYVAANQLTNLITLCHPCHGKAEHGKIPVQPYLL